MFGTTKSKRFDTAGGTTPTGTQAPLAASDHTNNFYGIGIRLGISAEGTQLWPRRETRLCAGPRGVGVVGSDTRTDGYAADRR